MSQTVVNPTPPILLALVTLLFAVTWNNDHAEASVCAKPRVAATAADISSANPAAVQPVVVANGAASCVMAAELVRVGHTEENSPRVPMEFSLARSAVETRRREVLPDWLTVAEAPVSADWLAALLERAEQSIVR